MAEYTPTTDEVRAAFIDSRDFAAQVAHVQPPTDEESGADFDRWLAEVRREAAEKALREAADWLAGMDDGRDTAQHRAGRDIIARIRDRAARIESATETHGDGHTGPVAQCDECAVYKPACPGCGSTDRFVLRGLCASDAHDRHEWHWQSATGGDL